MNMHILQINHVPLVDRIGIESIIKTSACFIFFKYSIMRCIILTLFNYNSIEVLQHNKMNLVSLVAS